MSVSVIVAAFNARETVERALRSALAQTKAPLEIIIVDDASTDDTRDVVARLANSDPRIRLIANPINKGPSGSRNAGIRAAKGEWIAVLDADDAWRPGRLEAMTEAARRYDVDLVADNQLLYDAASDEVTRTGFPSDRGVRAIRPIDAFEQEIKLGAEFSYGILKPVIRREFLNNHCISYQEDIRYGEDLLFLAEMLFSGARAVLISEPLYIYTTRVGDRTGKLSPHSKSVPRFDLFATGIDALKTKHPQAISPEVGRAMTRIARRFRLEHEANLAREKRRQRGLAAYALHVAIHPAVLADVIRRRTSAWRLLLPVGPNRARRVRPVRPAAGWSASECPMSVSVVIPAYNAEATIERAVMTVVNQTRPPLEVIVVDDASKDGTCDVVRRLAKADPRVKLLENEVNRGPSGSRNRGFEAARGEWIAVQDADDAWVETRLELMLDAAALHDADFVADNMLLHDVGADQITRTGFAVERGLRWIRPIDPFEQDVQMGAEFGYGLLQPMIRKRFLDEHGLAYNETLRYGEDMIFLMEMLFCGIRAIIIPDPGYIYTTRVGEVSGVASPHSKSAPRFDLISDGLDVLRAKYPEAITPEIERAMTRLARRYRIVHAANVAKQERLQHGLLAYAAYLGSRPWLAAHVLRQRGRKMLARRKFVDATSWQS